VLLGVLEGNSFVVKRGGLQVSYAGNGRIQIICYNPQCSHINVVKLPKPELVAAAK
jgi:hypothetical protein